jgi:hypothetical protein
VRTKRIKDIVAMLLIGEGTLIGARGRALVWRFGPEGLRRSASWQAEYSLFMRLEGAASIALACCWPGGSSVSTSILGHRWRSAGLR